MKDAGRAARYRCYRWLILSALVWLGVRCCFVTAQDGKTPFLSANDRSRWCSIRALVDEGTFAIDDVIREPGWDTIDKVYHRDRDGTPHFYSSKPPLYPTLLAVGYGVIRHGTGLTLAEHPFLVGRTIIATVNGGLLLILCACLVRVAERCGDTTWGRVFVVATGTWGTLLTSFGVTINNHLPAATCVMVAVWTVLKVVQDGERRWGVFFLAGAAAALAAACELPALALTAGLFPVLAVRSPIRTCLGYVPAVLLVGAAFFATTGWAHNSWRPPYAHRAEGQDWQADNWYNYPGSYWHPENRRGVDRGEPSRWRYAFHVILGHHGILSLTPVWCLVPFGLWCWLRDPRWREMAAGTLAITVVCLVFYVVLRPVGDRNYGGVTCGFRWVFWLYPLWLVALVPAADRMAGHRSARRAALLTLAISAASAAYGWMHPWRHPWLYVLTERWGGA